MAIYATNKGSDFEPAPEGLHRAVCCDVVELGIIDTGFGRKRMIQIRWQIEERRKDGKPFLVLQRYAPSTHPKANLRRDLESWRGKKFTEEEVQKFDVESILGKNCQLNVVHRPRAEGGVWANVTAIVPPAKNLPALQVDSYDRVCNREGYRAPELEQETQEYEYREVPEQEDDEVPF